MAYYTKVLQPDETVKVVGRLHWSIYIRGVVVLAVAAALLVGSLWLPDPDWQRYCAVGGRRWSACWDSCCCSAPGSAGAPPRSW